tara:strand:+ start:324 stop:857 length:534 start_codon:yes stop_codon:yes gene_type:complete
MDLKFTDLVKNIAELDVATAQAYSMLETETGIKIDSLTDFILKFIFTEHLNNRDVTITILSNTLMINENTVRAKLKIMIAYNLIEVYECGNDKRLKHLVPTELLNKIMFLLVACKLKTATDISPVFKEMFSSGLDVFYKEYNLGESVSFKKDMKLINFNKFFNTQKDKYPQKIRLKS